MARKSRQLRLEQAQELAGLYEAAGFTGVKKHRFITDMVTRLEGRDITGGQKKFLDSLIEQGAPEGKNQDRVAEIEAAIAVDGMQHFGQVVPKGRRIHQAPHAGRTAHASR